MDEEQVTNAVEAPESEPAQEEPSAEELKRELEETRRLAQEAEERYKGLQKTHQQAIEEGRITKGVQERLDSLQQEMWNQKKMSAMLIDTIRKQAVPSDMESYMQQNPQQVESAVAQVEREMAEAEARRRAEAEMTLKVRLFNSEAKAAGLSEEDIKEIIYNSPNGPDEAMPKIPLYAEKAKAKKAEVAEREEKERKMREEKEKAREDAKKKGETAVPVGEAAPVGTSPKLKRGDVTKAAQEARNPREFLEMTKGKEFDF